MLPFFKCISCVPGGTKISLSILTDTLSHSLIDVVDCTGYIYIYSIHSGNLT